jgi:osmoprotectant transport system ATP-binding protein
MKMTNRLIEPDSGRVLLEGVDVSTLDATALRRRMGYVIQQVGLFPHLTAAENIAVVPNLLGWEKKRIEARVMELLELVNLVPGEFASRYPAQLSGGQQQRVGLARALAGDPEVLLMDEPFGAIDALARSALQEEILALHRRLGKTILFVTHDVEEALRLADKMVVLREGAVVQYGAPCELLASPVDSFVSNILGADDRVRQISLLRVASVMEPALPGGIAFTGQANPGLVIGPQDSLRQALSLFLQPGASELKVVEDGRLVGRLTLDRLRESTCGSAPFPVPGVRLGREL